MRLFISISLLIAASLVVFAKNEVVPDKLYPDVKFRQVMTGTYDGPRAKIKGRVSIVRRESDGDYLQLECLEEDGYVICEIIPELPVDRPKVGDIIIVWGIVRYDIRHQIGEIHPLVGWELVK